ncbi:cytochrome b [Methylobacterium sp. JK268]
MPSEPDVPRYHPAQRGFHWGMAALIGIALALGIAAAYLPPGTSPRREILDIHKSIGLTVLVLLPLRLVSRWILGEPSYRAPPSRLAHAAARAAHLALYGLMLLMPLSGYVDSGAGGYSLPWFGLFSWPRLVPLDKALSHTGAAVHEWGAWAIGGLLALHVAAVVWHAAIRRDEVLGRMWPARRVQPT